MQRNWKHIRGKSWSRGSRGQAVLSAVTVGFEASEGAGRFWSRDALPTAVFRGGAVFRCGIVSVCGRLA